MFLYSFYIYKNNFMSNILYMYIIKKIYIFRIYIVSKFSYYKNNFFRNNPIHHLNWSFRNIFISFFASFR